jgi:hypothetical protein
MLGAGYVIGAVGDSDGSADSPGSGGNVNIRLSSASISSSC